MIRLPLSLRVVAAPEGRNVEVRAGRVVVGTYPLRRLTQAVSALKEGDAFTETVNPVPEEPSRHA